MESYTYRLESKYGGPEDDKQTIKIDQVIASPDGKKARLKVSPMRPGYVHELNISNVKSQNGEELLHPQAYYTLVQVPK
jgi:hypothetical protein